MAGCAVCVSAAPNNCRIGGCAGCCGGRLTVLAAPTHLCPAPPPPGTQPLAVMAPGVTRTPKVRPRDHGTLGHRRDEGVRDHLSGIQRKTVDRVIGRDGPLSCGPWPEVSYPGPSGGGGGKGPAIALLPSRSAPSVDLSLFTKTSARPSCAEAYRVHREDPPKPWCWPAVSVAPPVAGRGPSAFKTKHTRPYPPEGARSGARRRPDAKNARRIRACEYAYLGIRVRQHVYTRAHCACFGGPMHIHVYRANSRECATHTRVPGRVFVSAR